MRIPTDREIHALHRDHAPTREAFESVYPHSVVVCQVAEQLFVSPHTVSSHLRSVFAKLDINSRLALTRIADEHDTTAAP